MGQLAHAYQQFKDADVALLMVSVDSPKRAAQLAAETSAPFPVLSDVDDDVTVAYNLFASGIALPATVLIDATGRVRWVYVGQNPADRPSPDMMLDHVRHLGDG
jgi:peroxiredoxin